MEHGGSLRALIRGYFVYWLLILGWKRNFGSQDLERFLRCCFSSGIKLGDIRLSSVATHEDV